jgi:hypothetical protein
MSKKQRMFSGPALTLFWRRSQESEAIILERIHKAQLDEDIAVLRLMQMTISESIAKELVELLRSRTWKVLHLFSCRGLIYDIIQTAAGVCECIQYIGPPPRPPPMAQGQQQSNENVQFCQGLSQAIGSSRVLKKLVIKQCRLGSKELVNNSLSTIPTLLEAGIEENTSLKEIEVVSCQFRNPRQLVHFIIGIGNNASLIKLTINDCRVDSNMVTFLHEYK